MHIHMHNIYTRFSCQPPMRVINVLEHYNCMVFNVWKKLVPKATYSFGTGSYLRNGVNNESFCIFITKNQIMFLYIGKRTTFIPFIFVSFFSFFLLL